MAKVPVLTFDIGAVGDRVKQDDLGWTIDFNLDSKKILEKIEEISKNKEEYSAKKKNFDNYKFKTLEEMQIYYEKLYSNISFENKEINVYNFRNYEKNTKIFDFEQYQNAYGHVVHRYEKMRRTKAWQLAKKVKRILKRR